MSILHKFIDLMQQRAVGITQPSVRHVCEDFTVTILFLLPFDYYSPVVTQKGHNRMVKMKNKE